MTLASLSDVLVEKLTAVLPQAALRTDASLYLSEPRGRYAGQAGMVLAPANTTEVARIIRFAAEHRVGVVPYGGGTGLVGGQVMPDGPPPIILSLERMTAIRAVDPVGNVMVAEAGAVLADIQSAAATLDRLFPLSLASEGSARIGGTLATNAGGVNVLRYGNARDLCLGLEAVLPDGTIWNGLTGLRKDNTGYDLRHLLIGSEGTLGVITAASLKLFQRPAELGTALITVGSAQAALDLLALAQAQLGEVISAFELIGRAGFDFLSEVGPDYHSPFGTAPEWCVLIELGLAQEQDAQSALETLFMAAFEAGIAQDGIIAQSIQQRNALWHIRESIPEANRRIGSISSHDISVPIAQIPEFIQTAGDRVAELGSFRVNCFGHVGDGNLHYNVFPQPGKTRAEHETERDLIKTSIHDLVHELGGSVSAEHGIGRLKTGDLERYADPAKLAAMRAIKAALDPIGIMNPGAVLRLPV